MKKNSLTLCLEKLLNINSIIENIDSETKLEEFLDRHHLFITELTDHNYNNGKYLVGGNKEFCIYKDSEVFYNPIDEGKKLETEEIFFIAEHK